MASGAAHELGTPLATITLVTKELERELPKGSPLADDIALLRSQALRCREILRKLTRSPVERDPHHASLPVTQLLQEAAAPYRAGVTKVEISSRAADGMLADAVREPVGERRPGVIYGLGNIIENAVDFAAERVEVQARWTESTVTVTVADDGPGFGDAVDGTGMSIVRALVVDELGGDRVDRGLELNPVVFDRKHKFGCGETFDADAVQQVSAVLQLGPAQFGVMRSGLARFLEAHNLASVDAMKGTASLAWTEDPAAFQRASYIRTIHKWREEHGDGANRGVRTTMAV